MSPPDKLDLWNLYDATVEKFFVVRNSVIDAQNDLGRVNDAEPEDCAARCLELDTCQSFEYKAEHRKCDLSSARIEDNELIRSVHGWEIYAMFPNRAQVAKLTKTIESHVSETAELQAALESVQADIKKTERLLQNATAQVDTMMDERDGLAQDMDTLVALLQSSNDTLAEVMASYEELTQARDDLEETLSQQEAQITDLESSASSLTESVGFKDDTLRKIYAAKADTEAELAEVNGEVSILQSRVTSLNQQIQRLETELDAADDPEVYTARDCYELYKLHGVREDGVYDIYPFGLTGKSVKAFCYMGDGGGWTVIQRRDIASGCAQKFDKSWNEYKNGFGDAGSDYWLGNDAISSLTTRHSELKVYIKTSVGQLRYSHYRDFQMDSSSRNFKLKSVRYIAGNAGDQLTYLRNYSFGTKDRENNNNRCSSTQNGGFWFKTTRYCAKSGWWGSCSRYQYSCSTTNVNARTPSWSQASNWSLMRIRTQ
ncbi:angiopoietin-related protein 7-like [Liolophura sinensis]|uniref:angiopoietin-related protein 7-like n=1 Tax=Liolophura sinensis TaxID=3198878 RepID=UPI003158245E